MQSHPSYGAASLALQDAFPQRIEISVLREKPDVVDPDVDMTREGHERVGHRDRVNGVLTI